MTLKITSQLTHQQSSSKTLKSLKHWIFWILTAHKRYYIDTRLSYYRLIRKLSTCSGFPKSTLRLSSPSSWLPVSVGDFLISLEVLVLLNFLAWLGFLGLAGTSRSGWDFLAWLGLLGLNGTSWPGWDILVWMGLLGLAGTSWHGWYFLAWLGLLGLAGTSWPFWTSWSCWTSWPRWDILATDGTHLNYVAYIHH